MARAGKDNKAFTILELLVAMALLGIVVTLLASILSSTQKGVAQIGSASSQRQDARAVLDQISRDLRSTLEPVSRGFELANPGVRQPEFLLNPPGFTANGTSIFWSIRNESSLGGNMLVGYLLRWETSPGVALPRFCRVSFDPNDTESIKQTLQGSATANSTWINAGSINLNAPGVQDQGYQGWISDNILAFYARALDPQMNPITNYARGLSGPPSNTSSQNATFDASATGLATGGAFDSLRGYQYTRPDNVNVVVNRFGPALPAAVELAVVTAPPSAIKLLQSAPAPVLSGNASAMWTDVASFISSLPEPVRRAARTHSTIVPIAVQQ
jgi:prepilin-type N-terminal cleavage/methylation domain-containing protein